MAIYHLNAKVGSRKNGQSAKAAANYITRRGKYGRHHEMPAYIASGNMPAWAVDDPSRYWEAADVHEAKNGKLFYSIEFALPNELAHGECVRLAEEFAGQVTKEPQDVDGALPYTLAIHPGKGKNPHCHLMVSERAYDGHDRNPALWFRRGASAKYGKTPDQGGARKTRSMQPKAWLTATRKKWADLANQYLSQGGHSARIDHRSYADQGKDKIPQIHLGCNVVVMERKGIKTNRGDLAREIAQANYEIADLQRQVDNVDQLLNRLQKQTRGKVAAAPKKTPSKPLETTNATIPRVTPSEKKAGVVTAIKSSRTEGRRRRKNEFEKLKDQYKRKRRTVAKRQKTINSYRQAENQYRKYLQQYQAQPWWRQFLKNGVAKSLIYWRDQAERLEQAALKAIKELPRYRQQFDAFRISNPEVTRAMEKSPFGGLDDDKSTAGDQQLQQCPQSPKPSGIEQSSADDVQSDNFLEADETKDINEDDLDDGPRM